MVGSKFLNFLGSKNNMSDDDDYDYDDDPLLCVDLREICVEAFV